MIRNGSLNILINKQRIVAPTCYAELKTRQYVRLLKEWEWHKELADRDFFQLFSILSDTDYNAITRTIENDIALMDIVGWILTEEPLFKTAPTPTAFEFNDEIFSIDKLPGEMSIGQNIHLRSDFIEKSKILEESISIAIAIYLQPQITKGKFNLNKAKEIAKVIDEMPITRTFPLGFFFTTSCLEIWIDARKNLQANENQPRFDAKKNTARIAKVQRLTPFDDLSYIDKFAARFGMNPDDVYHDTSFDTVMAFATMWKETEEFNERFTFIWQEINLNPTKI